MKSVILFLLLFFVGYSVVGQQITQVEYWLEGNFENRQTQSVNTDVNNFTNVAISFPDNGENTLYQNFYFRFRDASGNWSPILSSTTFDFNDSSLHLVTLEYWFDNNFNQKTLVPLNTLINSADELIEQFTSISWPNGAQNIHYRFKTKYNQWSAILSSDKSLLVNQNNSLTLVEYWWGENFENRSTTQFVASQNGFSNLQIPFPDNGSNAFYDLLHYRFRDVAGNWSPILSNSMFNATDSSYYLMNLEYWFDNNFASKTTIDVNAILNSELELIEQFANVSWPTNAQKIHYRFKGKYNQWSAVLSSDKDMIHNVNNRVTQVEYWMNGNFDNRLTFNVQDTNTFFIHNQNFFLSANAEDTIYVRYKDKMNRWSSIFLLDAQYQGEIVEPAPIGSITLNTTKHPGGKISLHWNSVANAKMYMVYRNGKYWRSIENNHHPQNLELVDFPGVGNNTYYVVGRNFLGPNPVISNNSAKTITNTDIENQHSETNTHKYGLLNGRIFDNQGNRIDDVLVTFNYDGYTTYSNHGQFKREGVPFYTPLNITLTKTGYTFEPMNSNMSVQMRYNQTVTFIGTPTSTNAQNNNFKIEQTAGFTSTTDSPEYSAPFQTRTTIKNNGTSIWSGKIQLVANRVGNEAYRENRIIDEIQVTNLMPGAERVIEFTTIKLPLQPENYKLRILAYRFDHKFNSTIQDINRADTLILNNEISVQNPSGLMTLSQAVLYVQDALTASSIFNSILIENSNSEMMSSILSELSSAISVGSNYAEKANMIVESINSANTLLTTNNIIDYWKVLGNTVNFCTTPLCRILKMYCDVTASTISAIQQLENMMYSGHANFNFLEEKQLRLKIYKKKYLVGAFNEYFKATEFMNQIQSASFIGLNNAGVIADNIPLSKVQCNVSQDEETLCFVPPPMNYYYMEPGYKYMVKIVWTNGKITYIPFGTDYFEEVLSGNFEFKLNASRAGGNTKNIQLYAQPIFN